MKKEGDKSLETSSGFYYTCLHRMKGECPQCERDYNPDHFPNNYDCQYHLKVSLGIFTVIDSSSVSKLEDLSS